MKLRNRHTVIKQILGKKLSAGALLYAVFLTFIVSVISSAFLLSAYNHNIYFEHALTKVKVISNVNSAINFALSNPGTISMSQENSIMLFENSTETVNISKKNWGLYELFTATATMNGFSFSKTALSGDDLQSDEKIALYLTDKNNYLSICGNTILKGTCYLPQLGPKRAYIEGQSFTGSELVSGEIKKSNSYLPALNNETLKNILSKLNFVITTGDSVKMMTEFTKSDSIINSFSKKTLIIESSENIVIKNKFIKGNVIIMSPKSVEISSNAQLDDIIIYASSIKIRKGFSGAMQAIAADSLIVEENSKLIYPSCVALINNNNKKTTSHIRICEKASINGAVVLAKENKSETSQAILIIENDACIQGLVYCNDKTEHKGTINGSLYCDKLILKTASSIYENHLLNSKIDFTALSKYYASPGLFQSKMKKEVIKWLD